MAAVALSRTLDACAPLVFWAPALASGMAECKHGVMAETRFDHGSLRRGTVDLDLRAIEREGATTLKGSKASVRAHCSLETGAITPIGERAVRFLRAYPWLQTTILVELAHLRERAKRAAAQADRETTARRALRNTARDEMIPYDNLFPEDWDLIITHDGASYWAVEHHCPKPKCACTKIVVSFYRLDDGAESPPLVGDARLELEASTIRVTPSSRSSEDLTTELCVKYGDELRARYAEVRRTVDRFGPINEAAPPAAANIAQAGRIPRNGPCPCGSGKKYKRCCIDARTAATTRDLPLGARS